MKTKKKRFWLFLLSGVLMLSVALGIPFIKKTTANAQLPPVNFDENNIALTFTNFSDPHVGYQSNDELLRRALKKVKTLTPNEINVLQFCGDQTQDGKKEQAELFVSVLREEFDLTKTAAVLTHGNHDTYWAGCMNTSQFVDAYGEDVYTFDQADTDPRTGNRHIIMNGYHFLSVYIQSYTGKNFVNPVSAATEEWLKSTLDKIIAENPNQYIFVSCHCPAKDTSYGSSAEFTYGAWGASQEMADILDGYKQVVYFSGHTHYAINDERNITQTTYTQIQSGSLSDELVDTDGYYETAPVPNRREQSQGMLCEVDVNGNMRIMRYDFTRGMQVKDYWYLDACKADGSHLNRYTVDVRAENNVAPSFGENAKLKVNEVSTGAEIIYSAASDDDMVYHYVIGVYKNNAKVVEVKSYSSWMIYPNLDYLPTERKITLNYAAAYPYEIRIVAYDSFGLASEPLTITMRDTTEEDIAAALAIDNRITALSGKTLTKEDGESIAALRADINDMTYKAQARITKLADFNRVEAGYYNTFHLTSDAPQYVPTADKTFSTAVSESKGWVSASEYTGVTLNWNAATKNNSLGFDDTYALNGLHINFANMSLTSETMLYGIIISNQKEDKYLSNEALLLTVDFETGEMFVGVTESVGVSDCLKYGKIGATPFDMLFTLDGEGNLVIKVTTVYSQDTLTVSASRLKNIEHLADLTKCYVSFSPWENRTTGSFDVVAIHGGETTCSQYESEIPPTDDGNGNTKPNKKCGSQVAATCAAAGVLLLAGAAISLAKRKTANVK